MRILIIAGCLAFIGCNTLSSDNNVQVDESLKIRAGESFGECLGYCRHELEIDAQRLVLTSKGWDFEQLPDRVTESPMTQELWGELVSIIDLDKFGQLDETYGCPDCADGGAEWLEIEQESGVKKVTFEYGNGPAEIKTIVDRLGELRSDMKAEIFEN